jgi:hypothetical protein
MAGTWFRHNKEMKIRTGSAGSRQYEKGELSHELTSINVNKRETKGRGVGVNVKRISACPGVDEAVGFSSDLWICLLKTAVE